MKENDIALAFKNNHEIYLKKIHLYLNESYYKWIYSHDETAFNENELCSLKQVENIWIEHEKSDCLNKYDCYKPVKQFSDVEEILQQHPAYQHQLFNYLLDQGSLDDLKEFLTNDAILNLEFFDYLAHAVIGVSDAVRLEIINNLWDESGRGNIHAFHTTQFKKIMKDLGLKYDREAIITNMSWEGLAGINLFSYMSLYSSNKIKYFGVLAATEMLDPPHYHHLLNGFKRTLPLKVLDTSYYQEHVTIDVVHANGWMNKVILPILSRYPHKTTDFWVGFYLRLDSVQRYYDYLLARFMKRKAA